MGKLIHTVSVEFDDAEEAKAFAELVESDLGYNAVRSVRTIGKKNRTPASETRLGVIILRHARRLPYRLFTVEDFHSVVESHGYKASLVSPMLARMAAEGAIHRNDLGRYSLD